MLRKYWTTQGRKASFHRRLSSSRRFVKMEKIRAVLGSFRQHSIRNLVAGRTRAHRPFVVQRTTEAPCVPCSAVFQLGLFLRALRPARTGLRTARFTRALPE